jgi:hypothetical protein
MLAVEVPLVRQVQMVQLGHLVQRDTQAVKELRGHPEHPEHRVVQLEQPEYKDSKDTQAVKEQLDTQVVHQQFLY